MITICFCPMETRAENTVIVIDPGHSGKNHGAEWNGLMEKDLTMKVANAMLETLNEFEGVTVYLTHETERLKIAIAGYQRVCKDYNYPSSLRKMLETALR